MGSETVGRVRSGEPEDVSMTCSGEERRQRPAGAELQRLVITGWPRRSLSGGTRS